MGATEAQAIDPQVREALTDISSKCDKIRGLLEEAELAWTDADTEILELFITAEHSLQFLDGDVKMLLAREWEVGDA